MSTLLIIIGLGLFIYGILIFFGVIKTDTKKDSDFDKKHISEKTRYFTGRYLNGLKLIGGGLGLVVLGFIIYFAK